jgi:hypothetical protein
MTAQAAPTPAGWYPDPADPARGRYWNGIAWTDLYHTPGQLFPAGAEPKAPPGTDGNTVWIWLVVLLPVLPTVLALFVPWGSMYDFDPTNYYSMMSAMYGPFLSPLYWASMATSYLVYGLVVFFAYRDVKELNRRGVPKPFHWAFAFLGGIVYAVGRSIVVARRTGKGYAPIWAEAGVLVVSTGVMFVIMAMMFSGMADLFSSLPGYR